MKGSLLAGVLFLASGIAAAAPPLSVAGITPGMAEAQVITRLGSPQRTETGSGSIRRSLLYPFVRIDLDEDGTVAGARSAASTACLGNCIRSSC